MFGVGCGFVVASVPVGLAGLCGARDANAKKKGKPVPAGYKPRQWKLGLASCGIRGRGYLGIPDTARDLSKEEFDAILASWNVGRATTRSWLPTNLRSLWTALLAAMDPSLWTVRIYKARP